MRCSKQSFEADNLVRKRYISEKCVNNRTRRLWQTGTVKRIRIIQILNTALHHRRTAVFTYNINTSSQ